MPNRRWPEPDDVTYWEGVECVAVRTQSMLARMLSDLRQTNNLAIDTETKGLPVQPKRQCTIPKKMVSLSRLNVYHPRNEVIGVSLSCRPQRGYYIPLHLHGDCPDQGNLFTHTDRRLLPRQTVISVLQELVYDPNKILIFHNAPFEYKVFLKHLGIEIPKIDRDTLVLQTIINENLVNTGSIQTKTKRRKLKWLMGYYWKKCPICGKIYNIVRDPDEPHPWCVNKCMDQSGQRIRLVPMGELKISTWDNDLSVAPIKEILPYAACDAAFTLRLSLYLTDLIEKNIQDGLSTGRATVNMKGILDLEHKVIPALSHIELAGVPIVREYFYGVQVALKNSIEKSLKAIRRLSGNPKFRPSRSTEVSRMLWGLYGLKPVIVDQKGNKETIPVDANQLILVRNRLSIADKEGIPGQFINALIEYRKSDKLYTTYAIAIPNLVMSDDRVHPEIKGIGTTSGRGATSLPNLTNLPTTTTFDIRRGFVAPEGWVFVARDYKAMEFKLAAGWSKCPFMLEAINGDPHTRLACNIFNLPPDKIDKSKRDPAKTTNFACLYDITAPTLQIRFEVKNDMAISLERTQQFINGFFQTYSGFALAREIEVRRISKELYACTAYGRARHLPTDPSAGMIRSAFNSQIQGTGADIAKTSITKIYNVLRQEFSSLKPSEQPKQVLWVHDEIVVLSRVEDAELVAEVMGKNMDTVTWDVLIDTDLSYRRTLSKEKGEEYNSPYAVPVFTMSK